MAWLVCGTIPDETFPLFLGTWRCDAEKGLLVAEDGGRELAVERGTSILYAACLLACEALGQEPPRAMLVGDIGTGEGSDRLYRRLADDLAQGADGISGITFHYLYPDLDGHNRVMASLEDLEKRPLLVADAGFMYVAKMSGCAQSYDLFTPDVGELSFLADEKAPHPLYTRGFLLARDQDVPRLVKDAYAHGNAAQNLLVKGKTDTVVIEGEIRGRVDEPLVPTLEPIGGTGDIVAGLVSGFLCAGYEMEKACLCAARAARMAGALARPTPATQVAEILPSMAQAVDAAAGKA